MRETGREKTGTTAVLIPCYNESQTIEKVIREFREALPEADIYVYDNNSTDGHRRAGPPGRGHCAAGVPSGQGKRDPQHVS